MHSYDAIKALTEEYRSRFVKVIQQICRCKREYERNRDLMNILSIGEDIIQCIKSKRPCDLGLIKVKIIKKFLNTQVIIVINNEEITVDEFNKLVASAKFFKEWYDNDCSIDSYMQPLIGADHYDEIKEFLAKNLEKLQYVCDNAMPGLDLNDLPIYVSNGITKAISDLVRKV
ncbi:hypothetical protein VMUT_0811 [Vulcanisaeta moutnovskia 768-28]|uniref:Uncharacterized protein n=1 Tax=Vulcanisaeta moutnovskia (strain 768-28) TaxID=985053 RepID=F0QWH3_VULM7|nr:hypothetical protein [Vulcanisaeta moutnovskia]ADY01021.1 hypothetical protein VMUT_0811 [Vulcanisaeta moutnovskia 768-28]